MSYYVVHFPIDNSVEPVPESWVSGNVCWWPTEDEEYHIANATHPGDDWQRFQMVIKKRKLELKHAEKVASNYCETSEVSSDDGRKLLKRKIKPRKIYSDENAFVSKKRKTDKNNQKRPLLKNVALPLAPKKIDVFSQKNSKKRQVEKARISSEIRCRTFEEPAEIESENELHLDTVRKPLSDISLSIIEQNIDIPGVVVDHGQQEFESNSLEASPSKQTDIPVVVDDFEQQALGNFNVEPSTSKQSNTGIPVDVGDFRPESHVDTFGQQSHDGDDQSGIINLEAATKQTILERVFTKLEAILLAVKSISKKEEGIDKKVDRIIQGNVQSLASDDLEMPFMLPLQRMCDLRSMDSWLKETKNFSKLVVVLSNVGGSDPESMIRNILKSCIANHLATEITYTGKNSKQAFNTLNLKKAVVNAIRQKFKLVTEWEFKQECSNWFKYSYERAKLVRAKHAHLEAP